MDGEGEDDLEIHEKSKSRKKCKRLVWKERMHMIEQNGKKMSRR